MTNPLRRAPALPVLICLIAATASTAKAEDLPAAITSDSPAYCFQLHERVEQLRQSSTAPTPNEVKDLLAEGQTMCVNGHTRGGVLRMRRALTIIMHPDEAH